MKPTFMTLLLVCVLFISNLFSQTHPALEIGIADTLHSKILNADRPLQIYLPDNYENSKQEYPVIYLCDGQWNFLHVVGIVSNMAGNGRIPHSILVSIPHSNRDDDLVPKTMRSDNYSGKADDFQNFLSKELMPYIEGKYRTQPLRILIGHSYGGLFVHYTMITRPEMFDAFVAVDPSLWWDQYRMLSQTKEFFEKQDSFNKIIYFTQSEIESMGSDRFAQMLYRDAPRGLKWKFNHMRQETHGSVAHRTIYDGLEFIFSDWSPRAVAMNPKDAIFLKGDTLKVELSHPKATRIHYTLNGDEPTEASPVYEKPLAITKPCLVKARPFFGYGIVGSCNSSEYEIAKLQKAVKGIKDLKKGLAYKFYEGEWDSLPDFNKLKPKATGVTDSVGLQCSPVKDLLGLVFDGYIDIDKEEIYTFFIRSDDGSRLIIGGKELIVHDGLHSASEKSRQILLEKGKHKIHVEFFEKAGGEHLELNYAGPGIEKTIIPASVFYNK